LPASIDPEALLFKRDRRSGPILDSNISVLNEKNRLRNTTLASEVYASETNDLFRVFVEFDGTFSGGQVALFAAQVEMYPPQAAPKVVFMEQNWNIRAGRAICG
jgi:hypothetical protein